MDGWIDGWMARWIDEWLKRMNGKKSSSIDKSEGWMIGQNNWQHEISTN